MKKIIIVLAGLLTGSMALNAQTLYDVNRFVGSDLNGTARFVGMGGAMGALGGDISTASSNPAGIALFRSNDIMMTTVGLNNMNVKSEFGTTSNEKNKTFFSFDNVGVVITNKNDDNSSLRFLNFAVNYHRSKSFNRNMLMTGNYRASQTEQIANMVPTNITTSDLSSDNAYMNYNIPWLGILSYNARLINPAYSTDGTNTFIGYDPYYSFTNSDQHSVDGTYLSKEKGGINNFDFNIAFNFSDRFYLGATIGAYDIDYDSRTTYTETFWANNTDQKNDGWYSLNNKYNVDGNGVDFKLGFILRPIDESPFRMGFAFHTPTYYYITEHQIAYLDFDAYDVDKKQFVTGTSSPYDENGNEMESETKYRIVTPWKFNFNLGYTIGSDVALGAEYEYMDYSTSKMEDDNGDKMEDETNFVNDLMKSVSTVRLGAEFKVTPDMSFRLGYNYISPSMKDNAYKQLANNAVRTDTEYLNTKSINNLTFGIGCKYNSFYWDMAYVYSQRKADFYPFNIYNSSNVIMPKTKVTDTNNRFLLTLGFRF